ncbi:MAG TPA: ABC transporter ATP-binding protein [Streptosporangiaceae bacterium]|nr:ABC transporter ATP-binding protein [Streptosporangiaceae bacterium]
MSAAPGGAPVTGGAGAAGSGGRKSAAPVFEITGLSVDYGEGPGATHAVADVDLTLHRGEVLGLAGESGSGKSTLAYAATRLLRPPGVITGGDVFYCPDPDSPGRRINLVEAGPEEIQELRWSQISIVFQSAMHALNPVLTVEAQLMDALAAHWPDAPAARRRDRAAEMLSLVGINPDRMRSYPHELSGGMRQRVMIAMALLLDPQVVIMDEPTTALDVVTQREILQQITGLRDRLGFSVLFITHDFSLLVELADTIAVMYAGRLVETAPARELFRSPHHPYTLGLLGSFPSLHGEIRPLAGIPGSPPDLRNLPPGCAFHPRCPYAMPRCRSDLPRLTLAGGGRQRQVACWLHDGAEPPPELAGRREATTAAGARPAGGGRQGGQR